MVIKLAPAGLVSIQRQELANWCQQLTTKAIGLQELIGELQDKVVALPVTIAQGGTGADTQQGAITALAGSHAAGTYLRGDGIAVSMSAIQVADLPVVPVSGSLLRTPAIYAPATATTFSTTSATMSAVSSANVTTGSFTAPLSGTVIVMANFVSYSSSSNPYYAFGLCSHGTTSPMVTSNVTLTDSASASIIHQLVFTVTGLIPNSVHNFDLMYCVAGGKTLDVIAYGNTATTPAFTSTGGPVTLAVYGV